jgi:hypothetical protein
MWNQVLKHPERTPALGFYSQENPEVADWETKWAVEHGISFFVYCWYRAGRADAVETRFSSAIDARLKSRYVDRFKFAIMWENQPSGTSRGTSGITGEKDLLENLLPFWITNYFKHPSYLKIDNQPLLFVYHARRLAGDLGGVTNVPGAFAKMRAACRQAGFAGLYLLSEYRGLDARELRFRKDMGFDYTFAYVWPVSKPEQAVSMQLDFIRRTRDLGILPEVITVSQGWTGWRNEGIKYRIPPADYEGLLRGRSSPPCPAVSWEANCFSSTIGTSGAKGTTSRLTANTGSAISTPCGKCFPMLRRRTPTCCRKMSGWDPTTPRSKRARRRRSSIERERPSVPAGLTLRA